MSSGALAYARQHAAGRVFCGHTHEAIHVERDGIHYYNAGGWVDSRMTYLTVDEEGVRIHQYSERADHLETGQATGELTSGAAMGEVIEDAEYESVR